jgi:hypothetical protein
MSFSIKTNNIYNIANKAIFNANKLNDIHVGIFNNLEDGDVLSWDAISQEWINSIGLLNKQGEIPNDIIPSIDSKFSVGSGFKKFKEFWVDQGKITSDISIGNDISISEATSTLGTSLNINKPVTTQGVILGESKQLMLTVDDISGQFVTYNNDTGEKGGLYNDPIAIGTNSGYTGQQTNSIAIGTNSGMNNQLANSIAIGNNAGKNNQDTFSIALGNNAGYTGQSESSIAIGNYAGKNNQKVLSIAIGASAGYISQGEISTAIGFGAGYTNQGNYTIALGHQSAAINQSSNSIAIGNYAGKNQQGVSSIAIGNNSALSNQGEYSIAIGYQAAYQQQSSNAIAIGKKAAKLGQDGNSIAIGTYAAETKIQEKRSIVINASGSTLNDNGESSLTIKPINVASANGNLLLYDNSSGEITYSSISTTSNKTFVIQHPNDNDKFLVHACLEGPEAGVYYRGQSQITNNQSIEITLPDYVQDLASNFTVQITPISNSLKQQNISSSKVNNGKFTVWGNNCEFFWHVYATRSYINTTPNKKDVVVSGHGPYKYIL